MAQFNDLNLIFDLSTGNLLLGFNSSQQATLPQLTQGDVLNLRLRAVQPGALRVAGVPGAPLWDDVPLPAQVYVGIGNPGAAPVSGSFTLSWGGNTTSALPYNATPTQVQTALNALASITTAGGVSVVGIQGGPWQVIWTTAGSQALITADTDLLFPASGSEIYEDRAGASGITEIQVIGLIVQPAALASSFTAFPSAAVSVAQTQTGASGVPSVQTVSVNADAYGGFFTLSFNGQTTAAIAYNATAATIAAALIALSTVGAANITVQGAFPAWTVSFGGACTGSQPAITGNATGLLVPVGASGTLHLDTPGIEVLLSGKPSITTTLAIRADYGGSSPTTKVTAPVTILNDLIPITPGAPSDLPSYQTTAAAEAKYPRYDAATSYTSGQKTQFASNMGTAFESDLLAEVSRAEAAEALLATASALATTNTNLANEITRATAAEALKAPLISPAFTGTPTAPTAAPGANTTQVATTAFVTAAFGSSGLRAVQAAPGSILYTSAADYDSTAVLTIPANALAVGSIIECQIAGLTGQALTTAWSLYTYLKLNGTKSTALIQPLGTVANTSAPFVARFRLYVAAIGASGTLYLDIDQTWRSTSSGVTAGQVQALLGASFTGINTTAAITINVGAAMSAALSGNSLQILNASVRIA